MPLPAMVCQAILLAHKAPMPYVNAMDDITAIRALVGDVTQEQLRYVDCFVGGSMGIFIPAVGPCFYAITPAHSHPAYSFILHFDDNGQVAVEGKVIVPNPGEILAMDPGAVHHEIPNDIQPRYMAILIEKDFFEQNLLLYPTVQPESINFRSFPPGAELLPFLRDFMNESEGGLPGREQILSSLAVRITHSLIRSAYNISCTGGQITARMEIHKAIEYLHTHYQEKITVDRLAEAAGMSPSHFARVFRQETGYTPLDYLIRLRLQKSKKLLRAGEPSITTVALKCGFSSSSHFASCFHKHCGMTPSQFLMSQHISVEK